MLLIMNTTTLQPWHIYQDSVTILHVFQEA